MQRYSELGILYDHSQLPTFLAKNTATDELLALHRIELPARYRRDSSAAAADPFAPHQEQLEQQPLPFVTTDELNREKQATAAAAAAAALKNRKLSQQQQDETKRVKKVSMNDVLEIFPFVAHWSRLPQHPCTLTLREVILEGDQFFLVSEPYSETLVRFLRRQGVLMRQKIRHHALFTSGDDKHDRAAGALVSTWETEGCVPDEYDVTFAECLGIEGDVSVGISRQASTWRRRASSFIGTYVDTNRRRSSEAAAGGGGASSAHDQQMSTTTNPNAERVFQKRRQSVAEDPRAFFNFNMMNSQTLNTMLGSNYDLKRVGSHFVPNPTASASRFAGFTSMIDVTSYATFGDGDAISKKKKKKNNKNKKKNKTSSTAAKGKGRLHSVVTSESSNLSSGGGGGGGGGGSEAFFGDHEDILRDDHGDSTDDDDDDEEEEEEEEDEEMLCISQLEQRKMEQVPDVVADHHSDVRFADIYRVPETDARIRLILFQLLSALASIHSRGMAHGGVSTKNLVLTKYGRLDSLRLVGFRRLRNVAAEKRVNELASLNIEKQKEEREFVESFNNMTKLEQRKAGGLEEHKQRAQLQSSDVLAERLGPRTSSTLKSGGGGGGVESSATTHFSSNNASAEGAKKTVDVASLNTSMKDGVADAIEESLTEIKEEEEWRKRRKSLFVGAGMSGKNHNNKGTTLSSNAQENLKALSALLPETCSSSKQKNINKRHSGSNTNNNNNNPQTMTESSFKRESSFIHGVNNLVRSHSLFSVESSNFDEFQAEWNNEDDETLLTAETAQSNGKFYDREDVKSWMQASYNPPEEILGYLPRPTPAGDVWSAAVVAAELYCARPLVSGNDARHLFFRVAALCGCPSQVVDPNLHRWAFHVFGSQLPALGIRPTPLQSILSLASGDAIDLLSQMLCLDPSRRISAAEALEHPYFAVIQ